MSRSFGFFIAAALCAVVPSGAQNAPKPSNRSGPRKVESVITSLDLTANPPRVTLRDGAMTVILKPSAKLVQEERGLSAAELKVGDAICLITLKSNSVPKTTSDNSIIKEECRVTALNPLTLKIGDLATLTLTATERATFSREVPIAPEKLADGQTVAVRFFVHSAGDIDVQRFAVVTAPPKAKPKTTTRRKAVASLTDNKLK